MIGYTYAGDLCDTEKSKLIHAFSRKPIYDGGYLGDEQETIYQTEDGDYFAVVAWYWVDHSFLGERVASVPKYTFHARGAKDVEMTLVNRILIDGECKCKWCGSVFVFDNGACKNCGAPMR